MKRQLFLIIFFLLFVAPVFAQTETGVTEIIDNDIQTSCGGNGTSFPGDVCHIGPDLGETVRLGQSTATWKWVTDDETGERYLELLPIGSNVNHRYNIYYRPGPGYARPEHQWKADMLKAADPLLTPLSIIEQTVDFTNPQYETDRGRTCYYDNEGNLVKTEVSDTIYMLLLKYVPNLVQYSKRFTTYWALNKLSNQNYEEPTEKINKFIHHCPYKAPGTSGPEEAIPSQGIVKFTLFELIQKVLDAGVGIFVRSQAVVVNSRRNAKIEEIAAQGPGVIAKDMIDSPVGGAEKYAEQPGFIETFKVINYRPPEINAQVVDNPFVGSFDKNTTPTYMENLIECGYQYVCQTLWPAALVPVKCKYDPQIGCGQPTPTPTDTFGSVCEVADAYGIPCCQLEGIMAIETETGKTMGSEQCEGTNFSCCNGDVCGPAQIMCGQYSAFAGKDKLDLCSTVGSAELLSRAMLLKLCQAAGQCDSYDWSTQGEKAKKFKIADGEYTAAGYFYGMEQGCVASGCTQYRWGAGKTYCSGIEYFCENNGATPPDEGPYLEFCSACSEEYVNAGQDPIDCSQ